MFPTQTAGLDFDLTHLLAAGPAAVMAAPEDAGVLEGVAGVAGVLVWAVALSALVVADIGHAISRIHRAHLARRRLAGSHGGVLR